MARMAAIRRQRRQPVGAGEILYTFENVNMSKSFKGLSELARERNIEPEELEPGQYLLYLNHKKTACSMLGAGNVVSRHRKLSLTPFASIEDAVLPITRSFLNEGELTFDAKVDRALFKLLREAA